MIGFSDETLYSIKELFVFCDHILEEELSDQDLRKIQDRICDLLNQSEEYQELLLDQKEHSRSELSREIAGTFLEEDQRFQDFMKDTIVMKNDRKCLSGGEDDFNEGALYVEYLTGRAMQSIREALIGAMNLKTIQEEMI